MKDRQTQRANLQLGLNRIMILLSCVLFFFSSYIANYNTTVDKAWERWKYIIYFDFILILFSLRVEVKKLLTKTGYHIVIYLLLNYFVDQFFGLKGWSLNDFLTVALIILQLIFKKINMKKTISIIMLIISINATAQDSSVVKNLTLQAKVVEYLAVQMTTVDHDKLYTTFLDLRSKFRLTKPTGTTPIVLDSITTVDLANLYNYALSNSDGLNICKEFKSQIAAVRNSNPYLDRLCSAYEDSYIDRLKSIRLSGRKILMGDGSISF